MSCYKRDMANIQVKNVPDSLHKRLRQYARRRQCTMSEVMLEALERELDRGEFQERLETRPYTELGVSAASLLEEERLERDQDVSQ